MILYFLIYFILFPEGFLGILQKAEVESKLQEVKIAGSTPHISYLLFPDDSMIFGWEFVVDISTFFIILKTYKKASG